jgi:hypothetical protein
VPRSIPLSGPKGKGRVALVDDEDFETVSAVLWQALAVPSGIRYAIRRSTRPGEPWLYMHRLILGLAAGSADEVDHVNGDGLDNRRSNLRVATHAQNQYNQKPRGGTSAFKGVAFDRQTGRWRAKIVLRGRTIHLGRFEDERDAAAAYDVAARDLFGRFARTNF